MKGENEMTRKQQQIARIKKLQELLKKDKSDYNDNDKRIVRETIEKHIGIDWVADGYEGID